MWRQLKIAIISGGNYSYSRRHLSVDCDWRRPAFFHKQANGSLIVDNGKVTALSLIGQAIQRPQVFLGAFIRYIPCSIQRRSSSGSNLGPENPALQTEVQARIDALKAADPATRCPFRWIW